LRRVLLARSCAMGGEDVVEEDVVGEVNVYCLLELNMRETFITELRG